MTSVRSRASEASAAFRMCSGRLSSPLRLALRVEGEAELGRDHHAVADRLQGFAHQVLVGERAVDLGGVEEGDAPLHGGPEDGDHLFASLAGP